MLADIDGATSARRTAARCVGDVGLRRQPFLTFVLVSVIEQYTAIEFGLQQQRTQASRV